MSPPTSSVSTSRSSASKKRWKQPKTVQDFANQVNAVTTMLLNGEIAIETARQYHQLGRVLAQTVTAQVNQNRLTKNATRVEFDNDIYEDE